MQQNSNFITGRKSEIKRLKSYLGSRKSEFVAIYGRRRVGKTFLVRKTFDNQFSFQHTGLAKVGIKQQLSQFHMSLVKYGAAHKFEPKPARDWFQAFHELERLIESIPHKEKKVIFLDELPWLDTRNSNFISGLEYFWNSSASARDDVLLVVCGSAASWIIRNLLKNRGGLHNRITGRIRLNPFNLQETESFLQSKNVKYERRQILLIYMALGGIPYYLDFIEAEKSAQQNINDLCFASDAPFRSEYDNLYASLFNKHERHVSVVEALASKGKGLSRNEIVDKISLSDGGGLSRILKELEESSFIRKYKGFGKKRKEAMYQLIDMYSLFYIRFIRDADRDNLSFWLDAAQSPSFFSWAGYAFEIACLHHTYQIKAALGITGIQSSISSWQSSAAQIDLVIDRKDQVINLCEMKFSINPFSIDMKYAENLRNKLGNFRQETQTRKTLFLTFITSYGIAQNKYSHLVNNSLTMDVLFE